MNQGESSARPAVGDLQFDQAELARGGPAVQCKLCGRGIGDEYFEVQGNILCATCKDAVLATLGGSDGPRLARAVVAGLTAAILGAVLYWAVYAISGLQLGLVAIVVGVVVGGAVRWGSLRRGGPLYQAVAMALTYLSIAVAYFGFALLELAHRAGGAGALLDGWQVLPSETKLDLLNWAIRAPIEGNLDSPMGLIIVGIALYEAWKINKRGVFQVNGPFRVGSSTPQPSIESPPSA